MSKRDPKAENNQITVSKSVEDFSNFSHQVLSYVNRAVPNIDYLREISKMLMDFSRSDSVELWLKKDDKLAHCKITRQAEHSFHYEEIVPSEYKREEIVTNRKGYSIIDRLRTDILQGKFDPSLPLFTSNGSFWTGNIEESLTSIPGFERRGYHHDPSALEDYKSLALIPLVLADENIGLMQMMSKQRDHFIEKEIGLYESVAQTLGIALVSQRTQAALLERIKELTCLYNIARLAGQEEMSNSEILQAIVYLIPPAWQYPEITVGRITIDGHSYTTSSFHQGWQKQVADIVIKGKRRGTVEVSYTKLKPVLDEGPFLKEERNLLEVIAKQVALILERREAKEDSIKLQEQLRHADRLATIGQLAAGIAHELNEPLGSILGFAQLVKKSPELPDQIGQDIEKIVNASLHAREVIRMLMIFARQIPPKTTRVQLNQLVNEGLYFFEARCASAGIELVRSLSPDVPEIAGDQSQLNQVLINLVVNSIQAMPNGGKLTIQTFTSKDYVSLVVEDTGIGMSEDIVEKIFIPFFTTKDVDKGTGLGLAVVHGIVTSHKGNIKVKSKVGQGTRFEIQLPIVYSK